VIGPKSRPGKQFQYGGRLFFSRTGIFILQPWIEICQLNLIVLAYKSWVLFLCNSLHFGQSWTVGTYNYWLDLHLFLLPHFLPGLNFFCFVSSSQFLSDIVTLKYKLKLIFPRYSHVHRHEFIRSGKNGPRKTRDLTSKDLTLIETALPH